MSVKELVTKSCKACGDTFAPSVSKISQYCSADCLYSFTFKHVVQCLSCRDEFDPEFTKTFKGCSTECESRL